MAAVAAVAVAVVVVVDGINIESLWRLPQILRVSIVPSFLLILLLLQERTRLRFERRCRMNALNSVHKFVSFSLRVAPNARSARFARA